MALPRVKVWPTAGESRGKDQRGRERQHRELGEPGGDPGAQQLVARRRQRHREERRVLRARWQQSSGAKENGEDDAQLREILPERLHPDIAAIGAFELRDLADSPADLAGHIDVRRERQQRDDPRIGEHGEHRRAGEQHETNEEAPPRIEPRLVPEHVTPPRRRFRERSP